MPIYSLNVPMSALSSRPAYSVMPTGVLAETFPRTMQFNFHSPVSGSVYLNSIYLPAGLLITSIAFASVGTGATTPTVQVFGLYDSALALLRSTTDDGATAWAANATKTLNLTSTFTTTYEGVHHIAHLIAAATPPDLAGTNAPANSQLYQAAPRIRQVANTGATSLPGTAVFSGDAVGLTYALLK